MLIYILGAFAVVAVVNTISSTLVKINVNSMLPEDRQFSWWSRSTSGLIKKHRELFPKSRLADVSEYSGWAGVLLFAFIVLDALIERM
jgi:hypothetical protein